MLELYYNGFRLRADAADLAQKIGVDQLPQFYDFGFYAGMTRGEVEPWHNFADLIQRTNALLARLGLHGIDASLTPGPGQSVTLCLQDHLDRAGIGYKGDNEAYALFSMWDQWQQTYKAIHERQPMLRLHELVSDYSRSATHGITDWFYGNIGQCKLLDWVDGGCDHYLPFEDIANVVTPCFKNQLLDIRSMRIGWLMSPPNDGEYHLVWYDETEVAAFRRKYGAD